MNIKTSLCIAVLVFTSGCIQDHLGWQTYHGVNTLSSVINNEIFDNLVALHDNPQNIPAFATISAGNSQVVDQGTGQIMGTFGPANTFTPQLTGQRQLTMAWTLAPVTNANAIAQIRDLFLIALGKPYSDSTSTTFGNDFAPQPNTNNGGLLSGITTPDRLNNFLKGGGDAGPDPEPPLRGGIITYNQRLGQLHLRG